ncbi:MAG: hypothetical protein E5Y73_26400 [Mesorhizobium sp.]|uniref:DUF5677 domain-containing protein n=1 Tax=Mesorhizobium sp. TaxID=1871066 RepID=UPI00120BBDF6|nr:DUF5677 domain-containing protein [Mesorhizobium sp.]TIL86906.1 MAG: hypothetical protein E5Y73_26400 [Mesorhizobium sp.]
MNSASLRDYVVIGTQAEVDKAISDLVLHLGEVKTWINNNIPRTDRRVVMINFITSICEYLNMASLIGNGHVSILALATRSVYEIHLKVRLVVRSEDELKRWMSEALADKIQTLEGLLSLNTNRKMERERAQLRSEVDRLKNLADKYKLPEIKTPAIAASMAADLGSTSEHKALFKMFSKLVHPSSYLINNYDNAAAQEMRAILQVHLQLYAWDALSRISGVFSVPKELMIVERRAVH